MVVKACCRGKVSKTTRGGWHDRNCVRLITEFKFGTCSTPSSNILKNMKLFFLNKSYYSPAGEDAPKTSSKCADLHITNTVVILDFYFKMRKKRKKKHHRADSEYNKNKKKTIQQSALSMQNVPSQRLMSETKVPLVMSG